MHVADLIDAIYVQERTDDTDKQCKELRRPGTSSQTHRRSL